MGEGLQDLGFPLEQLQVGPIEVWPEEQQLDHNLLRGEQILAR
jgi:hypothetical protein